MLLLSIGVAAWFGVLALLEFGRMMSERERTVFLFSTMAWGALGFLFLVLRRWLPALRERSHIEGRPSTMTSIAIVMLYVTVLPTMVGILCWFTLPYFGQ